MSGELRFFVLLFQIAFVIAQPLLVAAFVYWVAHRFPRYRAYDEMLRAIRAGNVVVAATYPGVSDSTFFHVRVAGRPDLAGEAYITGNSIDIRTDRFTERYYITPRWWPRSITRELIRLDRIPTPQEARR
jgi:hypothetical protein